MALPKCVAVTLAESQGSSPVLTGPRATLLVSGWRWFEVLDTFITISKRGFRKTPDQRQEPPFLAPRRPDFFSQARFFEGLKRGSAVFFWNFRKSRLNCTL